MSFSYYLVIKKNTIFPKEVSQAEIQRLFVFTSNKISSKFKQLYDWEVDDYVIFNEMAICHEL